MERIPRLLGRLRDEFRPGADGRHSVISNGTWGALQQVTNLGGQALTAFLLVIVLSVNEFGVYSYAIALASLGINIVIAGLNGLAIKTLVRGQARSAAIVSAIMVIRESMAVIAYLILWLISLSGGSSAIVMATLIASVTLFARIGDAPEYWFKSQMKTRDPAAIRIAVTLAMLAVRVLAISLGVRDADFFLWIYVAESLIAGAWILIDYRRVRGSLAFTTPSWSETTGLMRKSFPVLLSGIANQVNLRSDVIFIQAIIGTTGVAVYSAAARIAEIPYFLPTVFMDATLPGLVELHAEHGEDSRRFHEAMQRSYDRAFWTGVAVAVLTGIVGTALILLFFGPEYDASIPLLWLALLACPFMFLSAVYSKWIITVDALWSGTIRTAIGAGLNVALNLLLLPVLGIVGASTATIVSYVVTAYLACFLSKRTRPAGWQMTLAIVAPARWLRSYLLARTIRT